MATDETYFRRALGDLVDDVLKPYIEEKIKDEVWMQMRKMKENAIYDEVQTYIRENTKKLVETGVQISLKVKED